LIEEAAMGFYRKNIGGAQQMLRLALGAAAAIAALGLAIVPGGGGRGS
jgi:hypothetical protein